MPSLRTTLKHSALSLILCAATAAAAVSPQEAARLGAELTPLGGEKAGNAAGTIPAWDGGLSSAAKAGFPALKPGARQPDPFATDKPLFRIDATNVAKYADQPDVARRFIEEAQIGGQLQHPGEFHQRYPYCAGAKPQR